MTFDDDAPIRASDAAAPRGDSCEHRTHEDLDIALDCGFGDVSNRLLPCLYHRRLRPGLGSTAFRARDIAPRVTSLRGVQFLLGHVSVQTTERYLGCKQRLRGAVNDCIGIEPEPQAKP